MGELKPVIIKVKLVEPVTVYFETQGQVRTVFYKSVFSELETVVTPKDTTFNVQGQPIIHVEKEYKLCSYHVEVKYVNRR